MIQLLRPHHVSMLENLSAFLKQKDVKFQQLAIATVSNLKKGLFIYLVTMTDIFKRIGNDSGLAFVSCRWRVFVPAGQQWVGGAAQTSACADRGDQAASADDPASISISSRLLTLSRVGILTASFYVLDHVLMCSFYLTSYNQQTRWKTRQTQHSINFN